MVSAMPAAFGVPANGTALTSVPHGFAGDTEGFFTWISYPPAFSAGAFHVSVKEVARRLRVTAATEAGAAVGGIVSTNRLIVAIPTPRPAMLSVFAMMDTDGPSGTVRPAK